MALQIEEQETHVNFMRGDVRAKIYTSDTTMMTKFNKLVEVAGKDWRIEEVHRLQKTGEIIGIIHNLNLDKQQRKDLESALRTSQIGSLDSALQEGEEGDLLGDMVACDTDLEGEVTDRIDQDILQALIWPMVDRLPGRQLDVIRKRYQESMTLKEIGEVYGVGIEAIRQAEREGLRGLRRSHDTWKLRAFLPEQLEAQAYRHNGVKEFNRTWESSTERGAMKLLEK